MQKAESNANVGYKGKNPSKTMTGGDNFRWPIWQRKPGQVICPCADRFSQRAAEDWFWIILKVEPAEIAFAFCVFRQSFFGFP